MSCPAYNTPAARAPTCQNAVDKQLADAQAELETAQAEVERITMAGGAEEVRRPGGLHGARDLHATPGQQLGCGAEVLALRRLLTVCLSTPFALAQEGLRKQIQELTKAHDAALKGKDAAVKSAVKAKEVELRNYQAQNAAAFDELNKKCKQVGRCLLALPGGHVQLAGASMPRCCVCEAS